MEPVAARSSAHEEKVASRTPLIKDHKVPLAWIIHLSPSQNRDLLEAICLAEAAGINWRKEWLGLVGSEETEEPRVAADIVANELPRLRLGREHTDEFTLGPAASTDAHAPTP